MSVAMTTRAVRIRLRDLENVIERGLSTFVEVGRALIEIRDSRLYKQQHKTFESYCHERWGFTPQHGGRLIAAAEVAQVLEPMGSIAPNERQARELAPLKDEPESMREAWQEASSNGTPTAEKVREVVQSRTGKMDVHYSSDTPEWSTPQDLFDTLNSEFAFDLDVCATKGNAKHERFFSPDDDGLAHEWSGVCWMNPPYGDEIPRWVEKAHATGREGSVVVCLVPARVDTNWWWDYCRFGEIRFLRGRLKFGGSTTSAPFPSAVVIFGPNVKEQTVWWEWR